MKNQALNMACGIVFVALVSCAAFLIAEIGIVKRLSFSPLIVGIILGMVYTNAFNIFLPKPWLAGVAFCSKRILRVAIILYGFRLTVEHIYSIGVQAIVIDVIVIVLTLVLGVWIGKLLKLDEETSLLTATGSAICGAAAVLGAESVLGNKAYKTAVAVSTVVVFGTLAMFLYPVLYKAGLPLSDAGWGMYTGATVHEVAHVVGAGNAMNDSIAASAIIVKMIRVIFLAPVLIVLSLFMSRKARKQGSGTVGRKVVIPWFAVFFIVVILFNSLKLVPPHVVDAINLADTFMLTMAMTALGMTTELSKFKQTGAKPFVLALALFVWLMVGGYFLVKLSAALFS